MKTELLKNANAIALALVSHAVGTETLADSFLSALGDIEAAGMDVNRAWATIAEENNWADREARIDGDKMPKTLQNYRSLSRKALALGITHAGKKFAAWRKEISAANKIAQASAEESATKIESYHLSEIELPGWMERANNLRAGMTTENLQAFDKYIHHHIEAFMNKKVK